MLDRIEKMRKKSRAERQRATIFLSIGLTAVIGLVWGTVVLPRSFTLNNHQNSRADVTSPFEVFRESFGLFADDAKSSWSDVMDVFQGAEPESDVLGGETDAASEDSVPGILLESGLHEEDFSRAGESLDEDGVESAGETTAPLEGEVDLEVSFDESESGDESLQDDTAITTE